MGTNHELGKALASGSLRFAALNNAEQYAMHSKKLELPAYDARGFRGMSLALATANRGGCHQKAFLISTEGIKTPFEIERFTISGKAGIVKLYQDLTSVIDSLGVCLFTNFALNPKHYADMASALNNIDYNTDSILATGERIWNLERLFNIREGFSRKDDTLPERILNTPLKKGHSKEKTIPLNDLLDEYYHIRGWNELGIPNSNTLNKLEIE